MHGVSEEIDKDGNVKYKRLYEKFNKTRDFHDSSDKLYNPLKPEDKDTWWHKQWQESVRAEQHRLASTQ